jgi:hypothetical protein
VPVPAGAGVEVDWSEAQPARKTRQEVTAKIREVIDFINYES